MEEKPAKFSSLKDALHTRLVDDMIKTAVNQDSYLALVVDEHTSKILSSCARMYDIMEGGVLVLQNLSLTRERLQMAGCYFIQPTESSVQTLITDFANPKRQQYTAAHVFFTQSVPDHLMEKIKSSRSLVSKLKTFQELNVDFLANERRVFTLDRPVTSMANIYFPESHDAQRAELHATADKIVSTCITLREFPHIRYQAKGMNNVCEKLAKLVDTKLKEVVGKMTDLQLKSGEPGTLLITDRSVDPVAPLMHEYTYQAMIHDLLKVKGELLTMPRQKSKDEWARMSKEEKEADEAERMVVLSEDDQLWNFFRLQHIGEVMSNVNRMFREFQGNNKMAEMQKNKDEASIKDMVAAMKAMPEYKQQMKGYHKHMTLAQECFRRYEAKRLKELGELEQDMATGLDEGGGNVSSKRIKQQLVRMCQSDDIGVMEKLRLLMIFIITQGAIQEQTRRELMRSISPSLGRAALHLEKLGVDLSKASAKSSKMSKERKEEFLKHSKAIPMALMRYLPVMHSVLSDLATDSLSENDYPYVVPPPAKDVKKSKGKSMRNKAKKWRRKEGEQRQAEKKDEGARCIAFVLGGVTHSEVRSMYQVQEQTKANMYIGSNTKVITARDFIRGLADLSEKEYREATREAGQADSDDESSQEVRIHK